MGARKPEMQVKKVFNTFRIPTPMHHFIKEQADNNRMSMSMFLSKVASIKEMRERTLENASKYECDWSYLINQEGHYDMNNYITIPEHSELFDYVRIPLNEFMRDLCCELFFTDTIINFKENIITKGDNNHEVAPYFKEETTMETGRTLEFKVEGYFARTPMLHPDVTVHTFEVDIVDVPRDIPMVTNPRNQNMRTATVKGIYESLDDTDSSLFDLLNRGLTLSAKSVEYDPEKKTVKILFKDLSIHGDIDGGHSYRAILEKQDEFERMQQAITFEVLTGDTIDDNFVKIASARNMSQQIVNKSIANLDNRFGFIKKAIEGQVYADGVFYRENDPGDIDIADIVAIINMLNIVKYNDTTKAIPTQSFSTRKVVMANYIEIHKKYGDDVNNYYYKFKNIITDILEIFDRVEVNFGRYYTEGSGKKFGTLTSIKCCKKKTLTTFGRNKINYKIPKGYLYLATSVFRAFVKIDEDGFFAWRINPLDVMDEIMPGICEKIVERNRKDEWNVPATARDKEFWEVLYSKAEIYVMKNENK